MSEPLETPDRSLWRRVFHRCWWTLGWSNDSKPSKPHVTWSLCFSNFNRPIVRWERWGGGDGGFFCVEWGNGNSDPAWSIGYEW